MFDLDPDQEEINLSDYDILQVVSKRMLASLIRDAEVSLGLVVLELNVQTVFNTNFHLDRIIAVWWHSERVNP